MIRFGFYHIRQIFAKIFAKNMKGHTVPNQIQPELQVTLRFSSDYQYFYIYMSDFIAFLKYFTGSFLKTRVLYVAMAEKHFRVAKSDF